MKNIRDQKYHDQYFQQQKMYRWFHGKETRIDDGTDSEQYGYDQVDQSLVLEI